MNYKMENYLGKILYPVYPVIGHFCSKEAYQNAVKDYYAKCTLHENEQLSLFDKFKADALKNVNLEDHPNADQIFDFAVEISILKGNARLSIQTWSLLEKMARLFNMGN